MSTRAIHYFMRIWTDFTDFTADCSRESQPKNTHTQQAGFEDRMLEVEREREGPSVMSA